MDDENNAEDKGERNTEDKQYGNGIQAMDNERKMIHWKKTVHDWKEPMYKPDLKKLSMDKNAYKL